MQTTFAQANYYNNSYTQTSYNSASVPAKNTISDWFTKVSIVSGMLSAFFIVIIAYSIIRMFMIQKNEIHHRDNAIHDYAHRMAEAAKNPRWELVEDLLLSGAEADWRVAIIEADVLLEEGLINMGFTGNGVGEMLTNAGENSFRTYRYAWDAHMVRNNIAHGGSTYKLSREDAVKTINMFRGVLEEFGTI